jgi:hypothetical protein
MVLNRKITRRNRRGRQDAASRFPSIYPGIASRGRSRAPGTLEIQPAIRAITMTDNTDPLYKRLSDLYRRDPQQFELERTRLINDAIEGFNPEHRKKAYGLQFKIDCQLRPYRDPVMRMNKMVEIFWQGVCDFQEVLKDPGQHLGQRQKQSPGKILPIQRLETGRGG